MSELLAEAKKALNKAKIDLMSKQNSTFTATIVWSLKQIFTEDIPTAGTNGIDLYVNPQWFLGLERKQRTALLAHEAWHVCLEHMIRGENYDHEIYNVAADYVINIMLQDAGYELPPHGHVSPEYRNMTTEQVYKIIYEKEKQNPSQYPKDIIIQGNNKNQGDKNNTGQQPEMSKEELKTRIESTIIKAHIQAKKSNDKSYGNIPSDLARRIEELTNPKLPWNVILQNFVNAFAKVDYSYARPKKKFMPDFYLPSLSGSTIEHIVVAIDSSGSVSDEEFTAFLQEIDTIKDFSKPNLISIIDFDSGIKNVHSITPDDDLWSIEFKGYGGTNLEPPFAKAKELKPDVMIVFSDLYCKPIEEETLFPVVWVCVNNTRAKVNFGLKIDMEVD